ncbi:MAG: DUF4446 family protein [Patescibacteria group bacterium]
MAIQGTPFFLALCSLFVTIGYIVWNERRMRAFLQHMDARTLEDTLRKHASEIEWAKGEHDKKSAHLANIEARLGRSIQKVETVRFNAFRDSGGGQSFATAFLSERGNGVVISTLYQRDRVSVFSKPVENFASTYTLTPEEKEAIEGAQR